MSDMDRKDLSQRLSLLRDARPASAATLRRVFFFFPATIINLHQVTPTFQGKRYCEAEVSIDEGIVRIDKPSPLRTPPAIFISAWSRDPGYHDEVAYHSA